MWPQGDAPSSQETEQEAGGARCTHAPRSPELMPWCLKPVPFARMSSSQSDHPCKWGLLANPVLPPLCPRCPLLLSFPEAPLSPQAWLPALPCPGDRGGPLWSPPSHT